MLPFCLVVCVCMSLFSRVASWWCVTSWCLASQSKKAAKGDAEDGAEEVKVDKVEVNYGPKGLKSGENVFGIVHIYASFNDTFVVRGEWVCVLVGWGVFCFGEMGRAELWRWRLLG
jgi:hypothetical protein